ncbi:MAG: hypothetical protein Q8P41_32305 [Pseudomonadota bacterium]|nr:hypothetical protein [Pseudomonadota bacterium]
MRERKRDPADPQPPAGRRTRENADPGPLLRALKFTRIPGNTIAEACARYGVSPGAYRAAKRAHGTPPYTDHERLLTAVAWFAGRADWKQVLGFLEWINEAPESEAAVRAGLDALVAAGTLHLDAPDVWALAADWP